MKLKIIFLAWIILFLSFQICFGQESSQPVKFYEFDRINCEELKAYIDGFYAKLVDEPSAIGYVVVYQDKDSLSKSIQDVSAIKSYFLFRRFDASRIKFVTSNSARDFKIEFWIVPAGAIPPAYSSAKLTNLSEIDKPILIGQIFYDAECYYFNFEFFTEFLLSNPDTIGKIVVYSSSKKSAKNRASEILEVFTKTYKISPKRLKFLYNTRIRFYGEKFWLVPQKKK